MPTRPDSPLDQLAALHTAALEAAETIFTEVHDRIEAIGQRYPALAPLFQAFAEALQLNLGTALIALVESQTAYLIDSRSLADQQKGP